MISQINLEADLPLRANASRPCGPIVIVGSQTKENIRISDKTRTVRILVGTSLLFALFAIQGCTSIERDYHRWALSESTSSSSFGYHMRRINEIDRGNSSKVAERSGSTQGFGFGSFVLSRR